MISKQECSLWLVGSVLNQFWCADLAAAMWFTGHTSIILNSINQQFVQL